jgi:glycine dehydrogenase
MLMSTLKPLTELENPSEFIARHIGISGADEQHMLGVIGEASRRSLIESIVPRSIARAQDMVLPAPITEAAALAELKALAQKNRLLKSHIGQGYYGTHTPGVILRNILENPAWYTAYTPYQAEISQGRMEALVNFQTMVTDLTAMDIANASMLDEATAAAEAMTLAMRTVKSKSKVFVVSRACHPQTIEVIQTRAQPLGIEVLVPQSADAFTAALNAEHFAALVQYPCSTGLVEDLSGYAAQSHAQSAAFIVAADLLALTLLKAPGEMGADIVVGTTQRFGMPMGAGGPHAAYMACRDEYKRSLPGRLVGVSVDVHGKPAYRLALQTREQHIRREKATSNICTAQVLPAVVASMYAVYHGPEGLKRIARRVASYTAIFAQGLQNLGYKLRKDTAFDTVWIAIGESSASLIERALHAGINLRKACDKSVSISLDETTTREDIHALWQVFASESATQGQALPSFESFEKGIEPLIPESLRRTSAFLTHPVFNRYHSETGMLRYIRQLSDKDLALDRSMIPLGSCTMKLNATSEMIPITWPEFAGVHPFAPAEQLAGYQLLDQQLRDWLCQATGYKGISLQPNAGSQGEYAGLLVIQAYHRAQGQGHRNICLIPSSAHGTNPASAQMVGMTVVVTKCDENGNVDMADLQAKCEQHSANLAAVMITYPSTHGVFETQVKQLCELVHQHGGRVYVDGANMNALVGVAAPGEFGGDVSHLNLHKTFCIPHGGGGPGVGPVCVVEDLVPYLPGHATGGLPVNGVGAVSAAPLGNAAVLPISWMYCRMMGAEGLKHATEAAILAANYISKRLADHYPTLYASENGRVAHECILDLRGLKETSGVMAEDVAKRLMD